MPVKSPSCEMAPVAGAAKAGEEESAKAKTQNGRRVQLRGGTESKEGSIKGEQHAFQQEKHL